MINKYTKLFKIVVHKLIKEYQEDPIIALKL
jgi:hypothetical protein